MNPRLIYVLGAALILGVFHGLSIAPSIGPLQIFSLAGFFLTLSFVRSAKTGFFTGFVFGLGWMVTALSWLYVSVHVYGGVPSILAALAILLFCSVLALFPGFVGMALRLGCKSQKADGAAFIFLLPSLWTLTAWLRNNVFSGFGWGAGSYAHLEDFFFGYAPFTGSLGIDFLNALFAGSIAYVIVKLFRRQFAKASFALIIPACIAVGGIYADDFTFGEPEGQMSFRLIQGGIAQDEKFSPMGTKEAFQRYIAGMQKPGLKPETVIVLPETIFPVPVNRLKPEVQDAFLKVNREKKNPIIFGGFAREEPGRYFNSAYFFNENGESFTYRKRHLVPFGEYVPSGFRWIVDAMQIPMSDQEKGFQYQKTFTANGHQLAPSLCYEDLFPMEIRSWWHGEKSPGVLVNLSNLGWFGDTQALPQHLGISRMRAKEFSRPMVRATNTGVTAAINEKGEVIAQLPVMEPGVLDVTVTPIEGEGTPYSRFGDIPVLVFSLLWLFPGFVLAREAGRRRR